MLPKKETDIKSCLEKLVGIRADCTDAATYKFFIEDLEGLDINNLSAIAKKQSPSGKQIAKDALSISAREMIADIEGMMFNTYRLEETFGSLCGTNDFNTANYVANGGLKITRTAVTNYAQIKVSRIELLCDFTGTVFINFYDGIETVTYEVESVENVIMPVLVDYTTNEKTVKITLSDPSISLAQITVSSTSGCNCSGRKSKAENSITYSGLIGSSDASLQYGFKVCAAIVCSNERLVCDMINQLPAMFGSSLLYKAGSKLFNEAVLTTRNNRFAGQDEEEKTSMKDYYAGLYKNSMNGTKQQKGIRQVIETYLKSRKDKCVVCSSAVSIGWVQG
jgi:hypothetical protein